MGNLKKLLFISSRDVAVITLISEMVFLGLGSAKFIIFTCNATK